MSKIKNILITGGAGLVGSSFVNYLIKKKFKVFVVDNLSDGKKKNLIKNKNLHFFQLSISSKKIENIISKNSITDVFHFAAKKNARESDLKKKTYYNSNYTLSKKFFLKCIKHNVKNFYFASSAAVYGDYKKKFHENDITRPKNYYGYTKLKFENYLKKQNKINICIFRFFNIVGPSIYSKYNIKSVVNILNEKFLSKKNAFYLNGDNHETKDGTVCRDFIHVYDIVRACYKIFNSKRKKSPLILNIGTGKSLSIMDLIKELSIIHKKKIKIIIKKKSNSDCPEVIADVSKIYKLFSFKPKINNAKRLCGSIN